jgi:MarR-like DNA-binding transcriptional regulator SgrR of sgrS sRNA
MTNDRKKIADKIQKLLAKAESTSHAPEADAFREKTEELMKKHSLTRAQIEEAEFIAQNWTPGYKSAPGWYKGLIANVGSFLGCSPDTILHREASRA